MRSALFRCLFFLISFLMLASCATKRPALQPVSAMVSVEQEGLAATLSFRDDESLTRQFGKETNPFRTEYAKMQFRRRLVFDLSLENRSAEPYRFRLKDCELQYGGKSLGPTNQFQLTKEWELMDENAKLAKQKEPVIKKYLLPLDKLVPPGAWLRGLLLFEGNLPAHGPATIYLPGAAAGSSLRLEFEF